MPTITTVDATWDTGVAMDAAELRRADTTMFLGDGSNNGVRGGIVYHGQFSMAVDVNGSDQVVVTSGACVIPAATGLGVYRTSLSATTGLVNIAARNATNPRIDLVVVQVAGASAIVKTIDGTPAASPTAPALPAQHIELGRINVPATGGGAVTVDLSFRTFATGLGGTLYVPTAARLPGSGNIHAQRAVVLDTNIEYTWRAATSAWEIQKADGGLTAGSGSIPTAASRVYRSGGVGALHMETTPTAAVPIDTLLYTVPAGYRSPKRVFFYANQASATVLMKMETDGAVINTGAALLSGVQVLGTAAYVIA